METITKHIGEGFARGELYACLAYDSTDQFGGKAIKQVRFNPAAGTTAVTIGDSTTALSYTAGTPLFVMYATTSNATATNAEPFYVKSTLTGSGKGGRSRFHTYANVSVSGNNMALKAHMEYGDSGKTGSGLAAAFCAELVMPNANTGTGGAYCVLELEYVAGGTSLVTAGNLAGNHASFIRATNSGDANGDFDDHGFLMSFQGLNDATGHVLYHNTLKMAVGTTTWYLPMSSAEASYTTAYPIAIGSTATPLTLAASSYPLGISGDVATTLTSGAAASQMVETGILTAKNITGTGQVFGILTQLTVEGTSTISTSGNITAIGAYYITSGTTTASGGIHSAMSAVMYAQAGFTVSASGIYCGLSVTDFTHATAVTNNDDGLVAGIFIANQAGTTLPNAIKVGANVTYFARFDDNDVIASEDAGTGQGWIRVNIGGYAKYIRTYDAA